MNRAADYFGLIERSIVRHEAVGIEPPQLNSAMFPHQRHATEFALRQGRSALFLDTGLGKSLCALDWGRIVAEHNAKPVLMLAPLGVVGQHVREAAKFGIEAKAVREQSEVSAGVNIANYERLHLFDAGAFGGLILDESSIIKSFSGIVTRRLMEFGSHIPFRLCCTATPAPNDHMELGQHSQFLGAMSSSDMLSRWFIADQRNMGRYRLKRAAVSSFWSWVASWSRCIEKPSDLGFSDEGFALPPLELRRHVVRADWTQDAGEDGNQARLFRLPDNSATAIHREKRLTNAARAQVVTELVRAEPDEPWLIWCDTDYEADELAASLSEAVEVRGSMSAEIKEDRLLGFAEGRYRVLITKASIAGFGLNYQHCARMAFAGLSFSYEAFYQAVRRCWRFGQSRPVHAHIACADTEEAIWQTINRKSGDHEGMKAAMREAMARAVEHRTVKVNYEPAKPARLPDFLSEAA
jgi:hypothetical protein